MRSLHCPRASGTHAQTALLSRAEAALALSPTGFLFSVGQDWPTLGTSLWPLSGAVCPCASCHLGALVWPGFLFQEPSPRRVGQEEQALGRQML